MDTASEISSLKRKLKMLNQTVKAMSEKMDQMERRIGNSPVNRRKPSSEDFSNQKSRNIVVNIAQDSDHWILTGKTFDLRAMLKQYTGQWDSEGKCWKIPCDKIQLDSLESRISETGATVNNKISGGQIANAPAPKKHKKPTACKRPIRVTKLGSTDSDTAKCLLSDSDSD